MIGQTISHYKILAKLGEGGMGVVYKAQDTKLNRTVALKFLPMELTSDSEAVNRFINEAQTASALDHANICTIYEIDETDDGRMFICMAYYDGETLRKKVISEQLSVISAIDIAQQIANGLARAHEADITHRDIKPENLIITTHGEVKIIDFGIAKLAGQSRLTKTGSTLGTMMYMSPEQLHGKDVDHRADIWALGVVLYEMLAGQAPFRGDYEAALVYAIAHELHEPLMRHRPEISEHLQRIVDRALEKNPDTRYQNAVEVLADLQRLHAASEIPLSQKVLESGRAGNIKSKLPKSKRAFLYGGITASLMLLIAVALYFFLTRIETIDAIAVLPLANLSGDPDKEFFADGMTEALISVLGQIEALRVISRTSVMQYKGAKKPLPVIAKELNVDVVVEGSVLRSGERVRITAQLIDAATDKHLWAESYERDLRDVLTLQRQVARAIAEEIQIKLTPQEQARLGEARAVNPQTYELYLWGRKFRDKETVESLQQAVKHFEQAIMKDPNFAPAYADLVVPYFILGAISVMPEEQAKSKTRQAVEKALELDETLSEAHKALGVIRTIYDWDWSGGEEALRRAIELNPSNGEAHVEYSILLNQIGRTEEGLAESKRAQELDPLSELANANVAWAYMHNHRYDEAIAQCRKTLALNPNSAPTHFMLGKVYVHKGMYEEALAELETPFVASSAIGVAFAPGLRGYAYAFSGKRDKALTIISELQRQQKRGDGSKTSIAQIYTGLGEKDAALTWLERACDERSPHLVRLIYDPIFDSLRSEPRFQALLKKMGLEK